MTDSVSPLSTLERLCAEATPGPWEFWDGGSSGTPGVEANGEGICWDIYEPDARFIAAADPVTVAALVRAVRASETLADYHRDFLGLPTLSEENLDAAVAQWAEFRVALSVFAAGREVTP